jgi:HPt (histidine-containing phosphotransfer) domain-containing protein
MHSPHEGDVLDRSVIASLKELGGDDDALLAELIGLFLDDSAVQVENLKRALAKGDTELLHRTAHTLKSSAANVGAVQMSKLCLEIERLGRAAQLDGVASLVDRTLDHYAQVRSALSAEIA